MKMSSISACRCCLVTEVKLLECSDDLAVIYNKLCGETFHSLVKPQLLCYECFAELKNCARFQRKCLRGNEVLAHLIGSDGGLTQDTIKIVDRKSNNLISNLTKTNLPNINIIQEPKIIANPTKRIKENVLPDEILIKRKSNIMLKEDSNKEMLPFSNLELKKEMSMEIDNACERDSCDSDIEDNLPLKSIKNLKNLKEKKKIGKSRDVLRNEAKIIKGFKGDYARVVLLTREQQLDDMKQRSLSANYVNSPHKCGHCYRGFLDVNAFVNHMGKHEEKRGAHVCVLCKCRYALYRQLRTHVFTSHYRRYQCVQCDHTSLTAHQAREHDRWHKGYKYECLLCGDTFRKSTSHLTHLRKAHPSEFVCVYCGDSFISDHGLAMHMSKTANHTNIDDIKETCPASERYCKECDVQFITKEAWTKHILISGKHSLLLENSTTCPICNMEFKTDVTSHIKTHWTSIRRKKVANNVENQVNSESAVKVTCSICSQSFSNNYKLKMHTNKVHDGQKYQRNIVCEVCGKLWDSKAALKYHQRTHSGERPYPCTICEKRFSNNNLLRIHARVHTGECPYTCSECGKTFRQKPALNRHVRVHTGVKPYTCKYCSKSFSQSNSMKLHEKSVHLKLPRSLHSNKVDNLLTKPS